MSALKVHMDVLRHVQTQLGATLAHADLVIGWQMMAWGVRVSIHKKHTFGFVIKLRNADIDECQEDTDGCNHFCSNTIGSYTCICRPGFRLALDRLTCNGIFK